MTFYWKDRFWLEMVKLNLSLLPLCCISAFLKFVPHCERSGMEISIKEVQFRTENCSFLFYLSTKVSISVMYYISFFTMCIFVEKCNNQPNFRWQNSWMSLSLLVQFTDCICNIFFHCLVQVRTYVFVPKFADDALFSDRNYEVHLTNWCQGPSWTYSGVWAFAPCWRPHCYFEMNNSNKSAVSLLWILSCSCKDFVMNLYTISPF